MPPTRLTVMKVWATTLVLAAGHLLHTAWCRETASGLNHLDVASHATNQSLLWGTYRSNLYFGLRPRIPESLMTGLIWWGATDYQGFEARHACDQGDDLGGYGWTEHDGRNYGSQRITDPLNNIQLTTQFLKVSGGEHGGSWAVRLSGKAIDSSRPAQVSLLHYYGIEGAGSLNIESEESEDGLDGDIDLSGTSPELGDFTLKIVDNQDNVSPKLKRHVDDFDYMVGRTSYIGAPSPNGGLWRAKEILMASMTERINTLLDQFGRQEVPDPMALFSLPNENRYGSNLFGFQRTYEAPFSVDVFFHSLSSHSTPLDSTTFSTGLEAASLSFHDKFLKTYPNIVNEYDGEHVEFAKELTASMLGGIMYFHGASIVDRNFAHDYDDDGIFLPTSSSQKDEDEEGQVEGAKGRGRESRAELTEPSELFSATPSRSFFPRGFYWDEGFHLLLIGSWDNDLSLDILSSWISLIDRDGWVAREQILGDEARSKVPKEFQVQMPNHANPPTLTIAVAAYIRRLRRGGVDISDAELGLGSVSSSATSSQAFGNRFVDDSKLAQAYLSHLYPQLKKHYDWFHSTQRGQIREWGRVATSKSEAYRWRGRSATHVLTSGLDDYPRARKPHMGELHLDLMCWMGFFTRTMKEIAEFAGEQDDVEELGETYEAILNNLEDLHWNEERQMYCDASVDDDDESFHVCHKGYISIFPLFLQLLPVDSPRLGSILDDLSNPNLLWSDYGIRSLSKSDPYYGQGENYWRGPIWVPMNYLVLSALHEKYAKEAGPYQTRAAQMYGKLRANLVSTVFQEWQRTGFVWEQYDANTGQGRRSRPFTGWTSMVAMIMAEAYE